MPHMPDSAPLDSFGDRLAFALADRGQLCVGIDPHPYLLELWGLSDSPQSLREFGLRVVEAAQGVVGIVKPQVAFFERHGSSGYLALEAVLEAARDASLLIIADVKRGDVGTSVEAYAQAWLTPGSALESDAMTISAFQGVASLAAAMAVAEQHEKGMFVLAATSNSEGVGIQSALLSPDLVAEAGEFDDHVSSDRSTVAGAIVNGVIEFNRDSSHRAQPTRSLGSIGVVLGATLEPERYGISLARMAKAPATPILAPGFGHQGAKFSELPHHYRESAKNTIVSVSRSLLSVGPKNLAAEISAQATEVAKCRG